MYAAGSHDDQEWRRCTSASSRFRRSSPTTRTTGRRRSVCDVRDAACASHLEEPTSSTRHRALLLGYGVGAASGNVKGKFRIGTWSPPLIEKTPSSAVPAPFSVSVPTPTTERLIPLPLIRSLKYPPIRRNRTFVPR